MHEPRRARHVIFGTLLAIAAIVHMKWGQGKLDFIIEDMNPTMAVSPPPGWMVLDTTQQSVERTVAEILGLA